MVVVDQSEKDTLYFNIPAAPNFEDVELSEEELEMVAGGGWIGAIAGGTVGLILGGPVGLIAGAAAGHAIEEAL